MKKFEVFGLTLPIIESETDLAKLIVDEASEAGIGVKNRDILVITSKLVQKAVGDVIDLKS